MPMTNPLMEPYDYLMKNPGKDIRGTLVAAFDCWIKTDLEKRDTINEVIGMLHTASLLIDDIEDNSELRRGMPVAHKIYGSVQVKIGTAQTINCANYVYFLAMQKIHSLNIPGSIDVFIQELLRLHEGQGHDIYWRDCIVCPTETEYLKMVSNKTGGLLRLAVKLMALTSDTNPQDLQNYINLVDAIGIHFQIRDDYINLMSTDYHDAKGFAEDLTEGKFSYPVVHCIQTEPEKKSVLDSIVLLTLEILKQRTTDVGIKKYAISLLQSSLEHTNLLLKQCENDIRVQIAGLGGSEILENLMDRLSIAYSNVNK